MATCALEPPPPSSLLSGEPERQKGIAMVIRTQNLTQRAVRGDCRALRQCSVVGAEGRWPRARLAGEGRRGLEVFGRRGTLPVTDTKPRLACGAAGVHGSVRGEEGWHQTPANPSATGLASELAAVLPLRCLDASVFSGRRVVTDALSAQRRSPTLRALCKLSAGLAEYECPLSGWP
ncbi:hypothetical protein SKAU_G00111100 [Synaphobranchus kaupii]|uniref:Uncharacterized protein n=1 Tax=Synaphobranchus kaupii TaxID=118154 RepID=A0A9Q1G0Q7_SYNKA|nr:hypothetical protein SKAU_G00111100 [Synaphobranchus kaupii]